MKRLAWLVAFAALAGCVDNKLAAGKTPERAADINAQLAIEYMKLDKLATAREFIERALGQNPRNANVQMTAGLVYERLNEPVKADHAFAAAARIGKGDPNILTAYGGVLCRTHRAAEGEKLFQQVVRSPLYQTPEVAMVNAGVCLRGTNDLVAETYFRQALNIRPTMPDALLYLGDMMLEKGDPQQALQLVQRYLAVNPAGPDILWLGMRTQRKLGDDTAAAGFARRLQTEFPDSDQARDMRAGTPR
jgi:type IV pilus assembly protein PilF